MLRATPSSRQGLLLKSSAFASFCTLTPSFPVTANLLPWRGQYRYEISDSLRLSLIV